MVDVPGESFSVFRAAGIEFNGKTDLLGSVNDLAPKLNGVAFGQFDFQPDQFFVLNGSAAQDETAGPADVGDSCSFLVQGAFPAGCEPYSYAWGLSSFIYHVCGGWFGQILYCHVSCLGNSGSGVPPKLFIIGVPQTGSRHGHA